MGSTNNDGRETCGDLKMQEERYIHSAFE